LTNQFLRSYWLHAWHVTGPTQEVRHFKIEKFMVVTNLQQTCSNAVPTTCQQDVFALLVPSLLTSCQRLVDNLLRGCWAQQTCYKLFQQSLEQAVNNL
jgi:hypothetical protein